MCAPGSPKTTLCSDCIDRYTEGHYQDPWGGDPTVEQVDLCEDSGQLQRWADRCSGTQHYVPQLCVYDYAKQKLWWASAVDHSEILGCEMIHEAGFCPLDEPPC